MVWQLYQPCHGCFWCGISNVRNSRSLNLMTAQKNKQHIKKILLSKTQLEYLSKLAYIVLSHQYTDLGCARQNMSQRCPELTKFLPICIVFVFQTRQRDDLSSRVSSRNGQHLTGRSPSTPFLPNLLFTMFTMYVLLLNSFFPHWHLLLKLKSVSVNPFITLSFVTCFFNLDSYSFLIGI